MFKSLMVTIGLLLAAGGVQAGDIDAGKARSAVCAACHGQNGISMNPAWPNLAGQKEEYIVIQLRAFRAGTRTNPLMSPQAAPLSDTDIANLAAYFSSLGCQC